METVEDKNAGFSEKAAVAVVPSEVEG